ncbi:amino acid transporter [Hyphomicrobium sulfonivorans]|uniref:Amino acid transporter n=1 Tax=Hyphomicrobium sulfonivorans TaxID=121290 RepID=A0A125NV27_HYPSL|nr:APC family permease [Hyphomicrobium sulfonivorans]KWT68488.1 amino acid transporter [Hyphomicrobium sulfonivorans]
MQHSTVKSVASGSSSGTRSGTGQIGMAAAVSIGIGGMVGAGIFSILGVVAEAAGNAMWAAFAIGGVVALLSTYSYAKLGTRYPSAGGAVSFLVVGYGDGVFVGGLNMFMWAGYIISLALYAMAFGNYAATFISTTPDPVLIKGLAIASVLLVTLLNAFGAKVMGRGETIIVGIKLAILILFSVIGLYFVKGENLSPSQWPGPESVLFGAGLLFIGYEGFGLITNTAADMRDPKKMLPRALYTAVILVIILYLAVSLTVSGNLTNAEIERTRDYALAEAAKPFLGETGFRLIAIAALLSTASAINATLFGSANICYMIARDGELPKRLSQIEWRQATGGLLLTAALVIVVMLMFDLAGIAMMGSAAFLLLYAAVNGGHLRILKQTGANPFLVWLAMLTCLAMFCILAVYTYQKEPAAIIALVGIALAAFAFEAIYRHFTGRRINLP